MKDYNKHFKVNRIDTSDFQLFKEGWMPITGNKSDEALLLAYKKYLLLRIEVGRLDAKSVGEVMAFGCTVTKNTDEVENEYKKINGVGIILPIPETRISKIYEDHNGNDHFIGEVGGDNTQYEKLEAQLRRYDKEYNKKNI